jgi:hypothetical protein
MGRDIGNAEYGQGAKREAEETGKNTGDRADKKGRPPTLFGSSELCAIRGLRVKYIV